VSIAGDRGVKGMEITEQIEQLNSIYARMIEAMTVNMNLKAKE